MKISIIHTNRKQRLIVSVCSMERWLQRISHDDARLTVTRFREAVPSLDLPYEQYDNVATWSYVYPAAVYKKDENGNMKWKSSTGLVVLTFTDITDADGVAGVKRVVAVMPSTYCTVEGADGRCVHVLVRYTDEKGLLPDSEQEAERLYAIACRYVETVYGALVKATLKTGGHSLRDRFMTTLDAAPYYNEQAVAVRISTHVRQEELETGPCVELSETSGDKQDCDTVRDSILGMVRYLDSRYDFRFNTTMNYTEYSDRETNRGFRPLTPRVQKRMTLEVQLQNIRVSIKDVRNFLESDYIRNYWPVDDFLFECHGRWDGHDHIRALARTVPTDNGHWPDWFYIWFLGMVNQWRHGGRSLYGNSVVPLLISRQGYNKSTFCRRLLPDELQWGYTDNLILSEKRQVLQAMSQFLLVNLDEFNQISPKVQQGFLKNIIQLPSVKIKRPYGSHVEEFPRTASFIATSNMDDILSDPSGNRRFIGIELTGPVDISVRPNYQQLYAQAVEALDRGEKCYFDAEQTALVMENNRQFQTEMPIEQCFLECFAPAQDERKGQYKTVAAIFQVLKAKFGASLDTANFCSFGRKLKNIDGLKRKRTMKGTEYLVVEV